MSSSLTILITALSLGALGSAHCAAMCGGFASSLQQRHQIPGNPSALKVSLLFNMGRLISYATAGAISAMFGSSIVQLLGQHRSELVMQLLVGSFLILLGLNLAGWWNGLGWVEKGGQLFWKCLNPLTQYVFPVNNALKAIGAGALWGWLPCGLVYSALVLVLGSGKPLVGASAMVLFGLGTMPMLVFVGLASNKGLRANKPRLKKIIGAIIMLFGSVVFTGLGMSGMAHH